MLAYRKRMQDYENAIADQQRKDIKKAIETSKEKRAIAKDIIDRDKIGREMAEQAIKGMNSKKNRSKGKGGDFLMSSQDLWQSHQEEAGALASLIGIPTTAAGFAGRQPTMTLLVSLVAEQARREGENFGTTGLHKREVSLIQIFNERVGKEPVFVSVKGHGTIDITKTQKAFVDAGVAVGHLSGTEFIQWLKKNGDQQTGVE
jgi:hypothetical protein